MDKEVVNTLNEKGQVIATTNYRITYDESGTPSKTLTATELYKLNENGYVEAMVRYIGNSTEPSVVEVYETNALGQRTKTYIDNYGDGELVTIINVDDKKQIIGVNTNAIQAGSGRVDRAEIYTLDAHGYVLKQVNNIGNTSEMDSAITYELDALGRRIAVHNDAQNNGNIIKTLFTDYEYTELGLDYILHRDKDVSGDLSAGDEIQRLIHNQNGFQIAQELYDVKEVNGEIKHVLRRTTKIEPDAIGQMEKSLIDHDNSGTFNTPGDEEIIRKFSPLWQYRAIVSTRYLYNDKGEKVIRDENRHTLNDLGQVIYTMVDDGKTGTVNMLEFGEWGGLFTVNHKEDLTTWSDKQLEEIKGLPYIRLSEKEFATEITLDATTVAKIEPTGVFSGKDSALRIYGDVHDTVNLSGFTREFDSIYGNHQLYTAKVDGKTYNVLVHHNVKVVDSTAEPYTKSYKYNADGSILEANSAYEYDESGRTEYSYKFKDNRIDIMRFGEKGEQAFDQTLDYRTWEAPNGEFLDVHFINLSNENASTTIILNKESIDRLIADDRVARGANGNFLQISGDSTDTVIFAEASSEYTKYGERNMGYNLGKADAYSTKIDGQDYYIWIDQDIKVEFGS